MKTHLSQDILELRVTRVETYSAEDLLELRLYSYRHLLVGSLVCISVVGCLFCL